MLVALVFFFFEGVALEFGRKEKVRNRKWWKKIVGEGARFISHLAKNCILYMLYYVKIYLKITTLIDV